MSVRVSHLDRSKRQLLALITAIRPSIIWRIDGTTAPLDLLDDDGIAGWRVGVSTQLRLLSSCSGPEVCAVNSWLVADQRREAMRWHDPQAVLTQALEVLRKRSWGVQRDPAVLEQWLKNIDAAVARYPLQRAAPTLFSQRQAETLHALLATEPGTELTRRQLARLVQAEPAAGDATPLIGCLSPATRDELLTLGSWLSIEPANPASASVESATWQRPVALEKAGA